MTLQGNDTKGTVAIHKTISYDSKSNKSLEEVTFFTKDTIVYQYDNNNKLVLVQKGKDAEKYSYNNKGLLFQKEITKFIMDSPMTYTESYRYVTRHNTANPSFSSSRQINRVYTKLLAKKNHLKSFQRS